MVMRSRNGSRRLQGHQLSAFTTSRKGDISIDAALPAAGAASGAGFSDVTFVTFPSPARSVTFKGANLCGRTRCHRAGTTPLPARRLRAPDSHCVKAGAGILPDFHGPLF